MTTDQPQDGTIDLTGGAESLPDPPINGHAPSAPPSHPEAMAPPTPAFEGPVLASTLDGVAWYPAYDRESVERYVASLEAEKVRLEAEIVAADSRAVAAEQALAVRTAEVEARLGAVVLAARAELDRIEQEQRDAVAAIRADAEAEAARIREAARADAATVRDAAASLASLSPQEPSDAG